MHVLDSIFEVLATRAVSKDEACVRWDAEILVLVVSLNPLPADDLDPAMRQGVGRGRVDRQRGGLGEPLVADQKRSNLKHLPGLERS